MKKIFKAIMLTIMVGIYGLMKVNAEEYLKIDYIDGVYFELKDGSDYLTYQVPMFSFNNKTSFCIEPLVEITTHNYQSAGWEVTSLTAEQRQYLELVGYYGYDYPSHKGNYRYYLATQELIWKKVRNVDVKFSTELNGGGDIIDVSAEKNEILSLVNAHETIPSFDNTIKEGVLGDTIAITDTNNVISEFDIASSGTNDVSIYGNKINIKLNQMGETQINLRKKKYVDELTIIYYKGSSQKLGHLTIKDPILSSFKVKATTGTTTINKLDKDTNNNVAQGQASLEGAVYEIYDNNNNLVTTLTTDKNGKATSGYFEKLGRYYAIEKTASKGYQLDNTKYYFDITENNLYPNIKVYEKVINKDYEFTKVFASALTGALLPEPNVQFGFYLNNQLVKSATTDKNGKINVNLPYGKYTVKQLTTTFNYEKLDDFEIDVNKMGDKEYKVIANAQMTTKLKVVKIDKDTKEVIRRKGIKFKIFSIDNNDYVCQKITYPFTKNVCEFETDSNGEMITPYPIGYGKYRLEEVDQAIDGYLWNKEPKEFELNEYSNLISNNEYGVLFEVKFENRRVSSQIHIIKKGETKEVTESGYQYSYNNLSNIKYGLFAKEDIIFNDKVIYKKGTKISEKLTDEDGTITFDNLYLGKYYIKELSTLNEYVLDNKEYDVDLNYKDQYTEVVSVNKEFKNKLKRGELDFSKVDVSTSEPLPDTTIEIYTTDDELVFSGITNKDGKIVFKNIPYGKYYLLEKNAPKNYKLNPEKMYFEIKEDGQIEKATMKDEIFTGTLEFSKVDFSTEEPLPNTTIEIYDENDKLIYIGVTDENGKITIEKIRAGRYYILEKNAPDGYTLNEEKMWFEIYEDGQIVKATMKDEKIVEVPNTYINDKTSKIMDIVCIVFSIVGLGIILYVSKKK